MKHIKSVLAAAAITVAVSASSASALTTTIDFSLANNAGAHTIDFNQGGVHVQAEAWVSNDARTVVLNQGLLTQSKNYGQVNGGGLGEKNAAGDSSHDIDGAILRNDLVTLKFDHSVKLKSVRFSRVDSNDVFDFYLNTFSNYQFSAATPFPLAQYIFAGGGVIGKIFGFGATLTTSDFKIRSVTVSAVPLPPTALLFLTGLLGIGVLGRRRSKSA